MDAFRLLSQTEGIVPAIESAHALAGAIKLGKRLSRPDGEPPLILTSLSGRGDKDVDTAITYFGLDTTGTGSESGEPVGTDPAEVTGEPLQNGGASTGAGVEL